ncbi:uncharacterized protein K444DRAFT_615979 [Hyaloscypha bicolor E]|uniref:Uncharacterized protein n=1 Tax=Hyaloscypha bicolor E TaxID=1095630 RepID=A0A2J6SZJ2_9HELO|nr:uncharacterized protein K444DRAFT_615979 [Hyaloscypha bicolor E]PMD56185.1 hypothetical protein K444DRAFT_615979 [Hyaloscypha bicolor E]
MCSFQLNIFSSVLLNAESQSLSAAGQAASATCRSTAQCFLLIFNTTSTPFATSTTRPAEQCLRLGLRKPSIHPYLPATFDSNEEGESLTRTLRNAVSPLVSLTKTQGLLSDEL